jgi:hypothetical protein
LRRPIAEGKMKFLGCWLILAAFSTTVPARSLTPTGSVTLAWNASTNSRVTGYNVYYGQASGQYTSSVDAGSNLTATVTGLTPGITYYFAAQAYNANGDESPFSSEVTDMISILPSILTQPQAETVIAANAAAFSSTVTGTAPLSMQWYFGTAAIAGATNSTLAWSSVAASNAGNYFFTVSNAAGAVTSSIATLTVIAPPSILTQPQPQTVVAANAAAFSSTVTGTAPLSMQWYFGTGAIAGATNSTLAWASVAASNAGNYYFTVSNAAGAVTSSIAALTVITPPSILTEPQSQTVIATTAASFSCAVAGTAPLTMQWRFGTTAIAGATNNTLAWASVAASNAGSYYLTVANAGGAVTSSVATLSVLPTNTIATVAGAYNGLFYRTNADGTPAMTEATAGFLGNCVVASNGAYSAKIYLDGASCPFSGVFSITGSASATISLPGTGLSNLTVALQLDLFHGSQLMTGSISSTAASNAWTAPLLGDLATNARPLLTGINLSISPGSSTNSPTNSGAATGLVVNGVLSLAGALGDTEAFSQSVPISTDGNVPLYINLYTNGGLLAGWINVAGSTPVGNLTWIRPSGVLMPAGFPQGFDTVVQVGGATYEWTTLVTGQTLGSLRNNWTGLVGFQFTCASNATCYALGRWVVAGNTQTHVVGLCSSSGTVLAYATVATAGAPAGTYAYASLAAPYAMTAGTSYAILSQETLGGDQWYDGGNTVISVTTLASAVTNSFAYGTIPSSVSGYGHNPVDGVYVPLNMQYTVP